MIHDAKQKKTDYNATCLGRHLLAAIAVGLLTTGGAANADDAAVCRDTAVKNQWTRAVPACTAAAERGDAFAQHSLGVMYIKGIGVAISNVQAFGWFSLAAAQGIAESQHNLGTMHDNGLGTEQDYVQAVRWYRQAAAQGLADAQFNLGVKYSVGHGVSQDFAQAIRWYTLAAENGVADAKYNLGLMHINGQGVTQDFIRAYMWFDLAAASGWKNGVNSKNVAASKMTKGQIVQAQRMAKDCLARKVKRC